jgi:hypothetical protein
VVVGTDVPTGSVDVGVEPDAIGGEALGPGVDSSVELNWGVSADAWAVAPGIGITSTIPGWSKVVDCMPFASVRVLTVTPNWSAISYRLSPG